MYNKVNLDNINMEFFVLSFVAGLLTVLAPCVFTLLPVILGGSLSSKNYKKPLTIIISLALSVFVFTLILRASTILIDIDPRFWNYLSGGILIVFGILTIFPSIWGKINIALGLSSRSDKLLHESNNIQNSFLSDIAIGASLGPVFSSCSPTYAVIIATILPQDFFTGVINLIAYVVGMALVLLLVALLGQKFISRFKWATDPNGVFKRILGVLLVVVGLMVITGFDKQLEIFLLDQGIFDPTQIENSLLDNVEI